MRNAVFATLLILCMVGTAKAADVFIGLDGGTYTTNGHYERRCQQVLVESAHWEQVWVEPIIETRVSRGKTVTVVIQEGQYKSIWIPARYETREVLVWVPGCYVQRPSSFSFGFGFGYSHEHHDAHGHRPNHNYNHGHRR